VEIVGDLVTLTTVETNVRVGFGDEELDNGTLEEKR